MKSDANEGLWCVVANIKRECPFGPGGAETKSGTRQFRGGTKVYIAGCYPVGVSAIMVASLKAKCSSQTSPRGLKSKTMLPELGSILVRLVPL